MWCQTSTTSWATGPTVRRTTALRPGWWTTKTSATIYLSYPATSDSLRVTSRAPISFSLLLEVQGGAQLQDHLTAFATSSSAHRNSDFLLQSARLRLISGSNFSPEELQLFTQLSRFQLSAPIRGRRAPMIQQHAGI